MNLLRFCLILLIAANALANEADNLWELETYVDAGYAASNRDPSNDRWASKSTTAKLNEPKLFLGMATLRKNAVEDSRWGFEFGLQAGDDSKGLVTSAPPPANEPFSNADDLRHFYRANVSYLFGGDRGVKVTAGLINSYIGYESYLGIDNPNYTRGYLSDNVPYLLFGTEVLWDASETTDLGFYLVNGFNYLADPNDVPSVGFKWNWQPTAEITLTQNLYYGSDQNDTSLEFWRFFSDTSLQWTNGKWLIAGAADFGTEKQAELAGQPRYQWSSGAIWVQWIANDQLSFAFRPEVFRDNDGLITGQGQTLTAYTGTVKYQFLPNNQRIVASFEVRYDTSSQPNFPDRPGDVLRGSQTLAIASINWWFDG